jgi:hypothetical protein
VRLTIMAILLATMSTGILTGGSLAAPDLAPGAGGHYCEAADGNVVEQRGTATCFAGAGSHAIAIGPQA